MRTLALGILILATGASLVYSGLRLWTNREWRPPRWLEMVMPLRGMWLRILLGVVVLGLAGLGLGRVGLLSVSLLYLLAWLAGEVVGFELLNRRAVRSLAITAETRPSPRTGKRVRMAAFLILVALAGAPEVPSPSRRTESSS